MPVHQNNTQLNLDMNLVYKILNDLRNPDQNDSNLNFKNDTLRVYSVPGTGIVADIRENSNSYSESHFGSPAPILLNIFYILPI